RSYHHFIYDVSFPTRRSHHLHHPQVTCPDHSHSRVPLVLSPQQALNHVLTRATVPDADGKEAGEDACHRKPLVRRRQKDLKLVRSEEHTSELQSRVELVFCLL